MSIFFPKAIRTVANKGKVVTSYFVTGICFLLIACNVAVFLFIPKIMLPLALILSNAITIVLMLFAMRPINDLLQREFAQKAALLMEQQKEEQTLRDRVAELESRNSELERRMDTWSQAASVPSNLSLSFKLETMTYDKSGYIVKEEPLGRFLEDPAYKLASKKGILDRLTQWMDSLSHPGERKVLYIGKYYIKASIGIDFTRIKFAVQEGTLTLFGVRFTKLNDLAVVRDDDEVSHCWLLNENRDGTAINQSEFYKEFTQVYAAYREKEAQEALEKEVASLCDRYTEVFRSNLIGRFPGIAFCDHIESSSATWYSLKDHLQDQRVFPIASNMLLMADVLNGTTGIS